jgi:hypothetical protein
MKSERTARLMAVVLIGISFGLHVHHDHAKWRQLGREAFLASEASRFDRVMLTPHPPIVAIIASCTTALFSFGVFELLAAGLWKVFGMKTLDAGSADTKAGVSSHPL